MFISHPLYREELNVLLARQLPWSQLSGTCVCVTGATGMIGSALVDALMELNRIRRVRIHVIAISRSKERLQRRFPSYLADPFLTLKELDLSQPFPWDDDVDYIVHAAANTHPLAFSRQPVETLLSAIDSTHNLLELLRKQGHGRLLYVSSGEIYGENPSLTMGFSESDYGYVEPMNTRSCYPEGKRASETLCAAYASQFSVDSLSARLCYVYGATFSPSDSHVYAQFLRRASAGEDLILKSEGLQRRSWCYLPDCVSALLTVMLCGQSQQAYNVAPKAGDVSIREFARILADIAGVSVQFDLPSEHERRGYSNVTNAIQRADRLAQLGWQAAYPLSVGLSHACQIYRDIAHRE